MKINHYTINTRHNRISSTEDVQKETIEYLTNLIKNAGERNPIELLDGAMMDLTTEQGGYIATIKIGDDIILATAGAYNKTQAKSIWKQMLEIAEPITPNKIELFPVQPPFVLDFVFPGAIFHQNVLSWTGDFTQCLGHLLLDKNNKW
nr:hypothetical protein [uncultured Anaerostipes sp.]